MLDAHALSRGTNRPPPYSAVSLCTCLPNVHSTWSIHSVQRNMEHAHALCEGTNRPLISHHAPICLPNVQTKWAYLFWKFVQYVKEQTLNRPLISYRNSFLPNKWDRLYVLNHLDKIVTLNNMETRLYVFSLILLTELAELQSGKVPRRREPVG